MPFAAIPDLTVLVYEHFYSKNAFSMELYGRTERPSPSPTQTISKFVRRLRISMPLKMKLFDKLRTSTTGDFGGANLLDIHISIDGENYELELDGKILIGYIYISAPNRDLGKARFEAVKNALEKMPPIEIRTKSSCIVYEHTNILTDIPSPGNWEHRLMEPWDIPLLEKTSDMYERYERIIICPNGDYCDPEYAEEFLQAWPEFEEDPIGRDDRRLTTRYMSIQAKPSIVK